MRLDIGDQAFVAKGRRIKAPGWRALFGGASATADDDTQALPTLSVGASCPVEALTVKACQTKPPAHFTEGTLIAAMKHAAKWVTDPRLKAMLKETAGLGTEATRAGIIKTLLDRGFIEKRKRYLHRHRDRQRLDRRPARAGKRSRDDRSLGAGARRHRPAQGRPRGFSDPTGRLGAPTGCQRLSGSTGRASNGGYSHRNTPARTAANPCCGAKAAKVTSGAAVVTPIARPPLRTGAASLLRLHHRSRWDNAVVAARPRKPRKPGHVPNVRRRFGRKQRVRPLPARRPVRCFAARPCGSKASRAARAGASRRLRLSATARYNCSLTNPSAR